jgi:hypothetical protein
MRGGYAALCYIKLWGERISFHHADSKFFGAPGLPRWALFFFTEEIRICDTGDFQIWLQHSVRPTLQKRRE